MDVHHVPVMAVGVLLLIIELECVGVTIHSLLSFSLSLFHFYFTKKKQLGADKAGSQPTTTSIVTLTQMIII
jgi:hypothetical protein